jgi:hypothetical protein
MRKKIVLLGLFFSLFSFFAVQLFCASKQLGIKAGILNTWTDFSGELSGIELKSINEFSGGIFLFLKLGSGRWGVQPELLFTTKGFDVRETDQELEISSKYKIDYYEIPILLSYRLFSSRRIDSLLLLGPYFAFPGKVREIQTIDGQTEQRELGDNLKETDAGMVFGLDFRFRFKRMFLILSARYHVGMTNISRDIQVVSYDLARNDTIKNRSLSLMFGLAFNLSSR